MQELLCEPGALKSPVKCVLVVRQVSDDESQFEHDIPLCIELYHQYIHCMLFRYVF